MPIVGMQAKWCIASRIFLHAEMVLDKKSGGTPWGTAKFREETSKKAARLSSAAEGVYRPPIIGMQARLCVAAKKYFTTGDCSRDDDGRLFTLYPIGYNDAATARKANPLSQPTAYVRGSLYGLATVSIWASWILAARVGLRTSLTPWDITAIRCGVAGTILLPYLMRQGLAAKRLGAMGLAAILIGGAAPMVLVSYAGLLFAPARHAACLFTALIPLCVAVLAAVVLGDAITVAKRIGLALIAVGALGIVWGAGGVLGSRQNIGHALFVAAAVLWAGYTVAMRKAKLGGLHAAAIAAVGSAVVYLPVYAVVFGDRLFDAAWRDVALQALIQGFLTPVVSYWCYGRAIAILGASGGSSFSALSPAITALSAIPLLGEWPGTSDWIAIMLISGGVYIASGGRLPRRMV